MTILIANVIQSTDSFGQWLAKTNQVITVISSTAVTTNSNTAVGNAAITGTFSANVMSLPNTGFIKIGTGSSNSFINATAIVVQTGPTTNTVITDTGVYVSGTALYTDVVMSLGNSVIRSSNITTDSFVLKNTLRLGNLAFNTLAAPVKWPPVPTPVMSASMPSGKSAKISCAVVRTWMSMFAGLLNC